MLVLELEGPFMHGHRDDLPCSYLDLQKDGRSLDYNSYLDTKVLFPHILSCFMFIGNALHDLMYSAGIFIVTSQPMNSQS
jgi:hypothetical protein